MNADFVRSGLTSGRRKAAAGEGGA
jgi:hypothetical protein